MRRSNKAILPIGDCAAGIGIRETAGYITSNTARFAPHVVQP
jgi:glutathionylspermidine synthase